jgi:hypothetical protein
VNRCGPDKSGPYTWEDTVDVGAGLIPAAVQAARAGCRGGTCPARPSYERRSAAPDPASSAVHEARPLFSKYCWWYSSAR